MRFFTIVVSCLVLCLGTMLMGFRLNPTPKKQRQTLNFHTNDFKSLVAAAKSQNKPFFVYFYLPECGACQKMDTISLVNEDVISFVNDNYLALRADGNSIADEGMVLAQKFDVHTFPTVMIFTPSGRPIYEMGGYLNPEILIGNLQQELANYRSDNDFCPAHVAHFHPAATVPPVPESKIEYPEGFEFDVAAQPNQEGTRGYKAPTPPQAPKPKKPDPNARVNASDFLDSPAAKNIAKHPTAASKNAAMIAQKQKEAAAEQPTETQEGEAEATEMEQENAPVTPTEVKAEASRGNVKPAAKPKAAKMGEAGPKPNPKAIAVKPNVSKPVVVENEVLAEEVIEPATEKVAARQSADVVDRYSLAAYPEANFGVQIGAFNDMIAIKKQVKRLEAMGENTVIVQEAVVNGKKVFKLILGGYETKEEALEKMSELKQNGVSGFVLGLSAFRG